MGTTEQGPSGQERFLDNQPRKLEERRGGPRRFCPSHTPLVAVSVAGGYEIECLYCGARGPKRETSVEAKLAFDGALGL